VRSKKLWGVKPIKIKCGLFKNRFIPVEHALFAQNGGFREKKLEKCLKALEKANFIWNPFEGIDFPLSPLTSLNRLKSIDQNE